MKHQIFITSCSWGCGEWSNQNGKNNVVHLGLEQYFKDDGYLVKNSSKGGGSNKEAIKSLVENLETSNPDDKVFFIQTDPLRDCPTVIINNVRFKNIQKDLEIHGSVKNIINFYLDQTYRDLDQVAQKFNVKIYLVGGLSSVNQNILQRYRHLNLALKNWIDILIDTSDYPGVDFEHFNVWYNLSLGDKDISELLRQGKNLPLDYELQRLIVEELHQFHENRQIFYEPIFHPDGEHPNRQGHKILFHYIKEKIGL